LLRSIEASGYQHGISLDISRMMIALALVSPDGNQ
jgi:hypothetical protein